MERMRGRGETCKGFPRAIFPQHKKGGRRVRRPHLKMIQAAFFADFAAIGGVFFALALAANSCLTMAAIASVSTL